jgi:hypothetical protein
LFGVKFWGVGGKEVHAPIASLVFGGSVGRRERRDVSGSMGCLWTYCALVSGVDYGWEGDVRCASYRVMSRHFLRLGDIRWEL